MAHMKAHLQLSSSQEVSREQYGERKTEIGIQIYLKQDLIRSGYSGPRMTS